MLTTRNFQSVTASKYWTPADIIRKVEQVASNDGQNYDTDFDGIGAYEYAGARGYQAPRQYLIPTWDDVVVVGLKEEQVFALDELMTFTMTVGEMEADIDCKVIWDEESDLTLFQFTNA